MTAVEPYQPRAAEVAHIDPTGGRLVAWAGAATAAHQLATSLSRTSFVPKAFQGNAADATAAIMLGDELGLSPIAALRSIYIISGTPALYARTMVALAMAHGHEVWTEESSDRQVTVCGRRRGQEHVERTTWTLDRARKAGYTSNKKYDTDPQAMLYSKAAAEIARKIAPDVLSGVPYSVEDLELEEPPPSVPIKRASSRVQRQQRPTPPEPEFEDTAPVPSQEQSETEPEPPTDPPITDAQLRKLHVALREAVGSDRDAGLALIGDYIAREISSTKDLTKAEASTAIDRLEQDNTPEPTLDGTK
jgi:hypothetical protein